MLALDGRTLRIRDVLAVADHRAPVTLDPSARTRMATTRAVVIGSVTVIALDYFLSDILLVLLGTPE